MTQHRDPVTKAPVPDTEPLTWGLIGVPPDADVKAIADALYGWLDEQGRGQDGYAPDDLPMVDHASDSYVTDHVLLTSAIAYCLAYDELPADDLQLIRLAALSHELANRAVVADHLPDQREFLEDAWDMLEEQGRRLEAAFEEEDSLSAFAGATPPDDTRLAALWKAHLAASSRLHNHEWPDPNAQANEWRRIRSLKSKNDFEQHPLNGAGQVELVFGGATKIKSYVFESARLPEVRGASTLFDRINRLDVPALWGRCPRESDYGDELAPAMKCYNAVREEAERRHHPVLSAPECVLYASGGNVLALAPTSLGVVLADAMEYIYTDQTLTGNSAAVAKTFDLLELQYGRRPQAYWLDDFTIGLASEALRPLLESYYKTKPKRDLQPFDFVVRKGFGELVTVLAGAMNRRRAGKGDEDANRQPRAIPHYELLPQTIKCHSCDTRPALVAIDVQVAPNQSPKVFCESCARKRYTGQVAKRDKRPDEKEVGTWFTEWLDWRPDGVSPWEGRFKNCLNNPEHDALKIQYFADMHAANKNPEEAKPANDVGEIGGASSPDGYIGYIYADGNDVGALVARIRTPAEYRQFAQRLYQAGESAVFTALGRHLQAHYQRQSPDPDRPDRNMIWVHPFEIITIGGDDFIVIVPGSQALEIATTISCELERRLRGPRPADAWAPDQRAEHERYHRNGSAESERLWTEDDWPAISLSAGIVIAQDHTPIPYISELAEQLQKSAKTARKTGKHAKYPGGTVDFAALKATGMVSLPWTSYRRRAFEQLADRELTARPFTWHELGGLIETARALKDAQFPRSQIYRLQEDLETSRLAASLNYLYFLSHLDPKSGAGTQVLEAFHHAWHRPTDPPPWRAVEIKEKTPKKYETIWRDLVEIYDFVPGSEESQAGEDSD